MIWPFLWTWRPKCLPAQLARVLVAGVVVAAIVAVALVGAAVMWAICGALGGW